MIYVYEDEIDNYLAMGYPIEQLHVIQYGEKSPHDEMQDLKSDVYQEVRKIVRGVIKEAFEFNNNKTFTPPPNVSQRAQQALNVVSKNNLTQSGTDIGSGTSKAKELASKQIQNFDQMRKIKSFFDTHEESYRKEKAAGKTIDNSGIIQSWELRGGDSSREWINQELSSLKKDNLNTKKNLRSAGGAGTNKGMGIFSGTDMISTNNHRVHR